MKLTINHLKGYLGTGLKILDLTTKTSFDLDKFYNQEIPIEFQDKYGKIGLEQVINDNQLLPLLHPLSSLTKYREDLGFVPIVELFKMRTQHLSDSIDKYYIKDNTAVLKLSEQGYPDGKMSYCHFFEIDLEPNNIHFSLATEYYKIGEEGIYKEEFGFIGNEMNMMQKLNEWHIDYQNLIKENLAIEIN